MLESNPPFRLILCWKRVSIETKRVSCYARRQAALFFLLIEFKGDPYAPIYVGVSSLAPSEFRP